MTEVLIWIAGSTLLFLAAILAGNYFFRQSAAKRRHLLSASLIGSLAIPVLVLSINSLSEMRVTWLNKSLEGLSTLMQPTSTPDSTPSGFDVTPAFDPIRAQLSPRPGETVNVVPVLDSIEGVLLQPIINEPAVEPVEPASSHWFSWMGKALVIVWLLGIAFSLVRLCGGLWQSHRYLKRCQPITDAKLASITREAGNKIGLKNSPPLFSIEDQMSPSVIGPFRPKVILSNSALDQLDDAELTAILTHELSHIKRHDLQLNFALRLVLAVHWFNPLAHLVFRQFRISQEELCDNEVTRSSDQFNYARLLIKVNQMFSPNDNHCVLAAVSSSKVIGRRVNRLLDDCRDHQLVASWSWRIATTSVAVLICLSVSVATAAIHFEPLSDNSDSPAANLSSEGNGSLRLLSEEDLEKETYLLLTKWHIDGNSGKLGWEHVPYLMKLIEDDTQISRVPSNPFSSQSQDNCTIGTAAMWFIDTLCCNRLHPALNPILVLRDSDETDLSAEAVASFKTWWELVKDWPASEAQRVNPLMFTKVKWYGGRINPAYNHSPVKALTNYFHHNQVVSVSPNGKLVFIAKKVDDEPTVGSMNKITQDGLVELWKINDFDAKTVFALDTGILVKTTDLHDVKLKKKTPDVEFIKDGMVINSVNLARVSDPDRTLELFNMDLQLDESRLKINAKFSMGQVVRKRSFVFDQQTCALLEKHIYSRKNDGTVEIILTSELHSDDQIRELAEFDIDRLAPQAILRAPILDVVPAGETLPLGEVFEELKLNKNLTARFRHQQQRGVILLAWQVSPSYDLWVMTGTRDPDNAELELEDRSRKVYGVRLLPTQQR